MVIRKATPDDIPNLVHLMKEQYDKRIDRKYFEWQFFYTERETVLLCAELNTKIIGVLGMQKRILGNGMKAGQAIDMLVSTLYRGKGIFKKLVDMGIKFFPNCDFYFVLPNLNGKNALLKLGWSMVSKIEQFGLFFNKTNLCIENNNTTFFFINSDEEKKWRFSQHPYFNYELTENLIYKKYIDSKENKEYIDIVYHKPKLCLSSGLFFQKEITVWAGLNTEFSKKILKAGFIKQKTERYLMVLTKSRIKDILNKEKWHLVQSDAEIY